MKKIPVTGEQAVEVQALTAGDIYCWFLFLCLYQAEKAVDLSMLSPFSNHKYGYSNYR